MFKADGVDEDKLMELALEAGAEDVKNEGEAFIVITTPVLLHKVKEALAAANIAVEAAEVSNVPSSTVAVEGEAAQHLLKLVDTLEDNDDVQSVSHNAEIPESVTI